GGGAGRHRDGKRGWTRRPHAKDCDEVPLILDRVAPPKLARPGHAALYRPPAPRDLVAEAERRAAHPRQERRARTAVKINRDVEPLRAQPPPECDVAGEPAQSAGSRRDHDLVQVRIVRDDRRGRRLDDVGEVRVRQSLPQRVKRRRGEDDVANLPQANEENPRELVGWSVEELAIPQLVFFDGGFVDEHDGNVVLDRIHTLARGTFERGSVLHERDRRFTVRAGENLEQLLIDRHAGDYMTPSLFCGTIQE